MTEHNTSSLQADTLADEFKQFAYCVSHDFNAPLRSIVEFSKLLREEMPETLSPDANDYLSLIIRSGEKMQAMMSGLLDYSRLNTTPPLLTPIDCTMLAMECRAAMGLTEGTITIGTLPTLTADARQLRQLLLILLENACKFHRPEQPPSVSVRAERMEGAWGFAVRDNGIGIEEKFYPRIFQPFQRLHPEGSYEGIGMGLTLAKKIIDLHHGRIWVEPINGHGTAFMFTIPDITK